MRLDQKRNIADISWLDLLQHNLPALKKYKTPDARKTCSRFSSVFPTYTMLHDVQMRPFFTSAGSNLHNSASMESAHCHFLRISKGEIFTQTALSQGCYTVQNRSHPRVTFLNVTILTTPRQGSLFIYYHYLSTVMHSYLPPHTSQLFQL